MPGNTLPLGNWDPWGLHQVSPEIVRRYRESEIKLCVQRRVYRRAQQDIQDNINLDHRAIPAVD